MSTHVKNPATTEDETIITNGRAITTGQSKVLTMVAERERWEKKERARLLRIIRNRECLDTGLIPMEFGEGDSL